MIKIRRKRHHSVPMLNLASMPDLIFTVLFFFIIVTHMRTESPKMKIEIPDGKELTKAEHKRSITNLYIGTDRNGVSHIQIGEKFVAVEEVGAAVMNIKKRLNDEEQDLFTINIRADKSTPMGVVSDVKHELRKAGALNIRYSAMEGKSEK